MRTLTESGTLIQIDEVGRRTRAMRLTFDPPCQCPAATPLYETPTGSGVRCAVERSVLSAKLDPSSLQSFCFGEYAQCPSWIAQKEWIDEGLRSSLLDQPNRAMEDRRREWEELGVEVELPGEIEVTHYHRDD
jgi:hypothetical protein